MIADVGGIVLWVKLTDLSFTSAFENKNTTYMHLNPRGGLMLMIMTFGSFYLIFFCFQVSLFFFRVRLKSPGSQHLSFDISICHLTPPSCQQSSLQRLAGVLTL